MTQTLTTAAAHIPDVYVDGVLRAMEFGTVIQPKVDRSWDFVGHGQTYHKSRIPNIEVQTKAPLTSLTPSTYTDVDQTIIIDVHQACAIKHEDIAGLLSKLDVKDEMTKKMGYGLTRAIDVNLATLAQNFSQSVGTLGVELTYDQLLEAVQTVEEAGYDLNDNMCWVISTAQKNGFMKMETFINAAYVGEERARKASENATIGTFQGAPIMRSNLVRSPSSGQHESFLFHKESIALIMAQEPKTSVDRIALDLVDVVVSDQVYGYAEVNRYSETPGNVTPTDEGAVLLNGV